VIKVEEAGAGSWAGGKQIGAIEELF